MFELKIKIMVSKFVWKEIDVPILENVLRTHVNIF
jgi:hypothetical protein